LRPKPPGRLIILSGPRGAGKTTLLQKTLSRLRLESVDIAGILSLPVEEKGQKSAIDGLDLRSGERRRLAIRNTTGKGALSTDNWVFDADAMQWADEILAKSTPCDLLVVDELGVLEFERSQGWLSGLKTLDERQYLTAIVVIRPELLTRARERWEESEVVEVTPATRSSAFERLVNLTIRFLRTSKSVVKG